MKSNNKPIGIITCGGEPNYGACLQAFATLTSVKQLGYNTELINYSFMKGDEFSPFNAATLKSKLVSCAFYRLRKKQWDAFKQFRYRYMTYSNNRVYNTEDLNRIKSNYSTFLIGSDQVWNPELGIDINITLLNFYKQCDGPKKISYGSSFGLSGLPEAYHSLYSKSFEDFSSISVRESSGKKIIESISSKMCTEVVDPVMLKTSIEWNNYCDDSKCPCDPYIFIYDMRHSKDVMDCAVFLSKKYNCKVFAVSSIILPNLKIKTLSGVSPAHFLSLIKNARAVVTDSFHGTVFSILFNKEFYTFCSAEGRRIGGRITNILEKLGIEDRLYNVFHEQMDNSPIDYTPINEIVFQMRQDSLLYLKNALKDE